MPSFQSQLTIATVLAMVLGLSNELLADERSSPVDIQVIGGSSLPVPVPNEPGELNCPFGVQFDSEGVMWVVEYDGGRVLKQSADGTFQPSRERPRLGTWTVPVPKRDSTSFTIWSSLPMGLFIYRSISTMPFACWIRQPVMCRRSRAMARPRLAGDGQAIGMARFNQPISIALSPDGNSLLVADIRNRRIREVGLPSKTIRTIAGNGEKGIPADGAVATGAPLVDPRAVAVDDQGNIYLAERGGHAIRVIRDGRISTVAGTGKKGKRDGPAMQATFNGPKHIEIASDGRVYLADDNNDLIRIYDPATQRVSTLDTSPYQLKRPHGVTAYEGSLYISDSFHHRILKVPVPTREASDR